MAGNAGLAQVTVTQRGLPGQNVPWSKEALAWGPQRSTGVQVGAAGTPPPAHLQGPARSKAAAALMCRTGFPGGRLGHPKGKFLMSQLRVLAPL